MWEYKIVNSSGRLSEEKLNDYGRECWELVGIIKDSYTKSLSPGSSISCCTYVYYFKRMTA